MPFLHASADKVLMPPTPPLPNQRQLQQRKVRGTAQSTASYAFGLDWLARLQQSSSRSVKRAVRYSPPLLSIYSYIFQDFLVVALKVSESFIIAIRIE